MGRIRLVVLMSWPFSHVARGSPPAMPHTSCRPLPWRPALRRVDDGPNMPRVGSVGWGFSTPAVGPTHNAL